MFTINAKHHPNARIWVGGDTFMVNGQRQPYVRNSRHEAKRAARLLSRAAGIDLPVLAVNVTVGAKEVTIKSAPADVAVIERRHIATWLRRRPERLREAQVDGAYEAARRSTTWAADEG